MAGSPVAGNLRSRIWVALIVLALVAVSGVTIYANGSSNSLRNQLLAQGKGIPDKDGLESLDIDTATGKHHFRVEVMRTDETRGRGLMERRFLPAERGMLFDFQEVRNVSMWMRNTYIPLDMVFIKQDGTVHRVEERTEPLSERVIDAGTPVLGVLELNAGTAAKIGLTPGDRVRHEMFGRR